MSTTVEEALVVVHKRFTELTYQPDLWKPDINHEKLWATKTYKHFHFARTIASTNSFVNIFVMQAALVLKNMPTTEELEGFLTLYVTETYHPDIRTLLKIVKAVATQLIK